MVTKLNTRLNFLRKPLYSFGKFIYNFWKEEVTASCSTLRHIRRFSTLINKEFVSSLFWLLKRDAFWLLSSVPSNSFHDRRLRASISKSISPSFYLPWSFFLSPTKTEERISSMLETKALFMSYLIKWMKLSVDNLSCTTAGSNSLKLSY